MTAYSLPSSRRSKASSLADKAKQLLIDHEAWAPWRLFFLTIDQIINELVKAKRSGDNVKVGSMVEFALRWHKWQMLMQPNSPEGLRVQDSFLYLLKLSSSLSNIHCESAFHIIEQGELESIPQDAHRINGAIKNLTEHSDGEELQQQPNPGCRERNFWGSPRDEKNETRKAHFWWFDQ